MMVVTAVEVIKIRIYDRKYKKKIIMMLFSW